MVSTPINKKVDLISNLMCSMFSDQQNRHASGLKVACRCFILKIEEKVTLFGVPIVEC